MGDLFKKQLFLRYLDGRHTSHGLYKLVSSNVVVILVGFIHRWRSRQEFIPARLVPSLPSFVDSVFCLVEKLRCEEMIAGGV